ncbi:MAG TPA: hypothetical protein VGO58_03905 [Chitinophagaceae bacterium]|nr:hypothetical protein [Chitinophagaceae bacterium]
MLSLFKLHIPKTAGIIFLLFFSSVSRAQNDENKITVDSTEVKEIVPAEEENGTPSSTRYFNERADRLSVEQRNLPPDVVKKMKEDEDFWYANMTIKEGKSQQVVPEREKGEKGNKGKNEPVIKEKEQKREYTETSSDSSSGGQVLLWILIVGVFIAGLVLYLGNSNIGLFRRKNRSANEGGEMDETITEDIFAINYQKDIDRAAAQGNYRVAIRLLFLRLLKNMSERNIIRYKQDKTNLDYLMELHTTAYYNNFFRVTRNYEYSWYGQFPVSEDAYKMIRQDFERFDKELR